MRILIGLVLVSVVGVSIIHGAAIDTTRGDIEKSINDEIARLELLSKNEWVKLVNMMNQLNTQWDALVSDMASVFVPSDALLVNTTLLSPVCIVQSATTHRLDGTPSHAFFCCHRGRLSPLLKIFTQAQTHFFGQTDTFFSWSLEEFILNIKNSMLNDMQGFVWKTCKDDIRIHIPEQNYVRALGYFLVGGSTSSLYDFIDISIQSFKGCITQIPPATRCISTSAIGPGSINTTFLEIENNAVFRNFCSTQALDAFDSFQTTGACNVADWEKSLVGPLA